MSSTITARVALSVSFNEIATGVLPKGVWRSPIAMDLKMANGTTTGQVDLAYGITATGIGASVTTVYDLAGSLTDLSGATITFVDVCTIAIRNKSATVANYLTVGPDATAGFGVVASNLGFWADASDRNVVSADYNASDGDSSWLILHCRTGVVVGAGSTDELAVITQGGTSANTWDIVILGRSA